MKEVTLKVGDRFQQAWKGCKEPMWFKVLAIDREGNRLRVACYSQRGYGWEETWDDLDVTENAFSLGEYKMILSMTDKERIENNIRMAEGFISEAKRCLSEEYDHYADVQRWMNKAEDLRMLTTILLSKHLNGKLV